MLPIKKLPLFVLALLPIASALGAEEEGVSSRPSVLISMHGMRFTNSILSGFAVSVLFVILVIWLVGRPKIIPGKAQAVVESAVEALRGLFEPIVGKKAFPATFPLLLCFFFF